MLYHRFVPAVALAAHVADQAVARQQCLGQCTGALAAAVRMNDQVWRRLALRDASCSAMHTKSVCLLGDIAQPTTLRACRRACGSGTTAQYSQPLRVRM